MKKIISYLILSIVLICCTAKEDQSVLLFNKIEFKLKSGEKVVEIDSDKKKIFNSLFDKKNIQIPLYKCIQSDNYLIFIGIPFNTTLTELSSQGLTHTAEQVFFEGDSTNYFYKRYVHDNNQITVYTRNFSNNLIYVLTQSNSIQLSDSLFNIKTQSNRFDK